MWRFHPDKCKTARPLTAPVMETCCGNASNGSFYIKCYGNCKTHYCINCACIDVHIFLFYLKTNSQFRCAKCCVDVLNERHIIWEEDAHNLSAIKAGCKKNEDEDVPEDKSEDKSVTLESSSQTQTTSSITKNQEEEDHRKHITCHFFKSGYCKNGTSCPYLHPKLCRRFMRGRNDKRFGCNKNECIYWHPDVCFNYEDYGFCDINNCRFFHRHSASESNSWKQGNRNQRPYHSQPNQTAFMARAPPQSIQSSNHLPNRASNPTNIPTQSSNHGRSMPPPQTFNIHSTPHSLPPHEPQCEPAYDKNFFPNRGFPPSRNMLWDFIQEAVSNAMAANRPKAH